MVDDRVAHRRTLLALVISSQKGTPLILPFLRLLFIDIMHPRLDLLSLLVLIFENLSELSRQFKYHPLVAYVFGSIHIVWVIGLWMVTRWIVILLFQNELCWTFQTREVLLPMLLPLLEWIHLCLL